MNVSLNHTMQRMEASRYAHRENEAQWGLPPSLSLSIRRNEHKRSNPYGFHLVHPVRRPRGFDQRRDACPRCVAGGRASQKTPKRMISRAEPAEPPNPARATRFHVGRLGRGVSGSGR